MTIGKTMATIPSPLPDAAANSFGRPEAGWRLRLYTVIFESDTPAGRAFDIVLIWAILASVAVVVLDSVPGIGARVGPAHSHDHGALTTAGPALQ